MTSRDAAYAALFALVTPAYAWSSTPSRRVQLWDKVGIDQRPALFQYEGGEDTYEWIGSLVKRTINARLFVYTDAKDDSVNGSTALNTIVDAIEALIHPPMGDNGSGLMTLGGLVDQARITKADRTPGDLDGDGIAIIDVEIILP
jgi:hypothetical protein